MSDIIGKVFVYKNQKDKYKVDDIRDVGDPNDNQKLVTQVWATHVENNFTLVVPLSVFIRDYRQVSS